MIVLNITRHKTTYLQAKEGVIDLPNHIIKEIIGLTTFDPIPTADMLLEAARAVTKVIYDHVLAQYSHEDLDSIACMTGFAPYFNGVMDSALLEAGFTPCYPYTIKRNYTLTNPTTNLRTKSYEHEFLGLVYNT